MGLIVSLFTARLAYFHPEAEGAAVHGANLATSALLQRCARDEEIEALEVFLPPELMARPGALAEAARALLGGTRAGQGFLRFHPVHALPEVWADHRPRILLCFDPEDLPRTRYLRDRFATGPMPICSDTHTGESQQLLAPLTRMVAAEPVAYDAIVCLSDRHQLFMQTMIADLAPGRAQPALRLETIPRAVDTERFVPLDAEERRRARQLLGLPADGRITLFFGRVTAYTKADLLPLIDAFIAASTSEDHLLIVGQEYPAGYTALLRETGAALGHRLIIRDEASPTLRPLYHGACDVFVLPGDNIPETFGNAVLEALACGVPVIASDWVGYSHSVEHEVNGLLVPTWWMPGLDRIGALSPMAQRNADHLYTGQSLWVDATALTQALRRLLQATPATRAAFAAAGRQRAEAHSPAIIHARWRALWAQQLTLAAAEPPSTTELRREAADRLGQPSRYLAWFGHYASGVIGPAHRFRLNEHGRMVAARTKPLRFYDDLLPLVHREIIDGLFAALTAQAAWITCETLVTTVASGCRRAPDDVRFHLGLLLKRGLLDALAPAL